MWVNTFSSVVILATTLFSLFSSSILFFPLMVHITNNNVLGAQLAAMSIDFGSQFMKIGLVKPGVPMEIVLNKESRRKTPNLIGINKDERFFGDNGLAFAIKNPKNSFVHLVDLLGKTIDNPIVSLYKQRFPFINLVADDERKTVNFIANEDKYDVETLVAMVLDNARRLTESFAEQSVKDVVITVPAFFNQAERRAMTKAAEIAGLNLLQLLNDHTAAGLSYGIFRRKEINEQSQTLLIYDMGATKTTAAILEFRLEKDKKSSEKYPVMSTIGFGYDRTLGGLEISLRMRDHLVKEFQKAKKTAHDITENPRAMAKMFKEAERVKQVLSANTDHIAQVESVHEDQDFRVAVTRAQLEEMIKDLEPRIIKPIEDALKMAQMNIDEVGQVVLMGAATRTPKVQELVRKYFNGKELGKFLNTDESIAMGAVYQAAHLSKGFKVKRFDVRDLQIFPIQVDFVSLSKKDNGVERIIHRPIFGYKSFFPSSKKILSFSSYTKDFTFNVNYGELKHLTATQLSEFGSSNISNVEIIGVTKTYESEMAAEGAVYKPCEYNFFQGIKAYFNMDESGIISVESAEVCVEKLPKEESAFASLAGKISGFFSSGSTTEATTIAEPGSNEDKNTEPLKELNEENKAAKNATEKDDKDTSKENNKLKLHAFQKNIETVAKLKLLKFPLEVKETRYDVDVLSAAEVKTAKKRLSKFVEMEKRKAEREEAHNTLESLVYDISDKLEQESIQVFVKAEEKDALTREIERVRLWLEDEADISTPVDDFVKNKEIIDKLLKPVTDRINEHNGRPAFISDMLSLLNSSETFVFLGRNLTDSLFTDVELNTLEKITNETKIWWEEKNATQLTLAPTDTPAYTIEDLKEKIRALDRELRYLVNKMKFSKPKVEKGNKEGSEDEKSKAENVVNNEHTNSTSNLTSEEELKNDTVVTSSSEADKKKCEGKECNNVDPTHDATEL
uniref:Hypoxia up-regulated protein 1 n=1 Tax=Syphacia muris TaxID=451379 RepID=A0A0N5AY75_9BILA